MATSGPTGFAGAGAASTGATAAGDKARDTSQISRSNANQKNQERIIHRTKNCIIVAGQNKREDQEPVSYRNFLSLLLNEFNRSETQTLVISQMRDVYLLYFFRKTKPAVTRRPKTRRTCQWAFL